MLLLPSLCFSPRWSANEASAQEHGAGGEGRDTAEPPRPREPAIQGRLPREGFLLALLTEAEANSRTAGY